MIVKNVLNKDYIDVKPISLEYKDSNGRRTIKVVDALKREKEVKWNLVTQEWELPKPKRVTKKST